MTTFKPRQATIPIYQGDDLDHLQRLADDVNTWQERLDDAIRNAKDAPPLTMLEENPVVTADARLKDAREAHDAFLAEAEPRAIKVVVQALGRKRWREIVDQNPPREDNEGDKRMGVNDSTFGDVLVPISMVEPQLSANEQADFLDALSMAQYRSIYLAAFLLNTATGEDPKALSDSGPSLTESETQP